jgi:trans-2,3-dihydro-3-hydroxyanthranilate isomerase
MHRFVIADVFTDRPFSGNQLAVLPDAQGLSDREMQAIAREFNFPESTFVLPPADSRNACRVRIFTPVSEMQFAGHPTVGTAAVLAHLRKFELPARIVLEEGIGPVPVDLARRGELVHAQFTIDKPMEIPGNDPERAAVAAALSLPETAVLETWFASGGVRFCFARLADRAAVDRAGIDRAAWTAHFAKAWAAQIYFFCGDRDVYARMFAPALGIEEDAATGSAAVGLAGVLAGRMPERDGVFTWRIDQGVAMRRPSRLEASAEKSGGQLLRVKVGGTTVISAVGEMTF